MEEAVRIYRTLFDAPIPPVVAQRFAAASQILERNASPAEREAYARALAQVGDLEALELACRYTKRLPLLTRKLALMAYLAETVPENQDRYINRRSSLVVGLLASAGAVVRTVAKMITGLFLLRRLNAAKAGA